MSKNSKQIIKEAIEYTKQISAEELMENRQKFLILDVREKEEIDIEPGIENSLKIPRGLLEFYADEESPLYDKRLETDKTIVALCTLGLRGALAAKTLQDMGYTKVGNLKGGLNSLKKGG